MNESIHWMRIALDEAKIAAEIGEVPVGAVVVREGMLLGRGHNRTKTLRDPTAHAEIIAITAACEALGDGRLDNCDLFVTLEPCAMCAGAMLWARVKRLYFATADPKAGACGSMFDIVRDPRLNHQVEVYSGGMQKEAAELLSNFFQNLRQSNGNASAAS